jgi:hypothetical protein
VPAESKTCSMEIGESTNDITAKTVTCFFGGIPKGPPAGGPFVKSCSQ